MSIVATDLLQNRLGTNAPAVLKGQFIRSWCSINNPAVTIAILGSFNTSSVTDNGVGQFAHQYTTFFTGAGFCRIGTSSSSAVSNGWAQINHGGIPATGTAYSAVTQVPAVYDPALFYMCAIGDLA